MIDRQCFLVDIRSPKNSLISNKIIYASSLSKINEEISRIIERDIEDSFENLVGEKVVKEFDSLKEKTRKELNKFKRRHSQVKVDTSDLLESIRRLKHKKEHFCESPEHDVSLTKEIAELEENERDIQQKFLKLYKFNEKLNGLKGASEKKEEIKKEWINKLQAFSIEDYEVKVEDLLYIVVEGRSPLDLTRKVNSHIDKGWKTLGGVQIGGAGGASNNGGSWSEFYFVQSLTRGSY